MKEIEFSGGYKFSFSFDKDFKVDVNIVDFNNVQIHDRMPIIFSFPEELTDCEIDSDINMDIVILINSGHPFVKAIFENVGENQNENICRLIAAMSSLMFSRYKLFPSYKNKENHISNIDECNSFCKYINLMLCKWLYNN